MSIEAELSVQEEHLDKPFKIVVESLPRHLRECLLNDLQAFLRGSGRETSFFHIRAPLASGLTCLYLGSIHLIQELLVEIWKEFVLPI